MYTDKIVQGYEYTVKGLKFLNEDSCGCLQDFFAERYVIIRCCISLS